MKKRKKFFIIAACVATFVGLYLFLMLRYNGRKTALAPTFSTQYTDEYGLEALYKLLGEQGMKVERNFYRLTQADLGKGDNLVLMAPLDELSTEEKEVLLKKVKRGMNLLACPRRRDNFLKDAKINLVETESVRDYQRGELPLEPAGPLPMLNNVNEILYLPDEGSVYLSEGINGRFGYYYFTDTLALVPVLSARNETHLGYTKYGNGKIFLVSHPYIFTNEGIGKYDNALLVTNLFRKLTKEDNGRIIFDEYHQGFPIDRLATPLNEPPVRYMMWAFVGAFVISVYSFSRRVGRPIPEPPPPGRNISEFVESVARVYRKRGEEVIVYREVVKRFLHKVKSTLGLNPAEPLKMNEAFRSICTIRFGEKEAQKLDALLQSLQSKNQINEEDQMVSVVQQIRQFSIRNKLDQNG